MELIKYVQHVDAPEHLAPRNNISGSMRKRKFLLSETYYFGWREQLPVKTDSIIVSQVPAHNYKPGTIFFLAPGNKTSNYESPVKNRAGVIQLSGLSFILI